MRLTKHQKIGLLAVGIGLVALVFDRIFVLPKSAPAEHLDEYLAQSVIKLPEVADSGTKYPVAKLRARLERLWAERSVNLTQTRDAFLLPTPWLADVRPNADATHKSSAAFAFAKKHQLRAIVESNQGRQAFVDDKLLVLGEELDGYVLVAINEGSVCFEANENPVPSAAEGRVVLKLMSDR